MWLDAAPRSVVSAAPRAREEREDDDPIAKRLICSVKPPKHMLGDTAYDDDGLRKKLDQRETKPVIPNHPNKSTRSASRSASTKLLWRFESAFNTLSMMCAPVTVCRRKPRSSLSRSRFRFYGTRGGTVAPSPLQTADNRWSALWHC